MAKSAKCWMINRMEYIDLTLQLFYLLFELAESDAYRTFACFCWNVIDDGINVHASICEFQPGACQGLGCRGMAAETEEGTVSGHAGIVSVAFHQHEVVVPLNGHAADKHGQLPCTTAAQVRPAIGSVNSLTR